jgi:putative membrane protein
MVTMAFLTDSDKQRIAETIRQVEMKTSGELVTVIAREADDYYYIPTLWAALTALLLPACVTVFELQFTLLDSYGAQISLFLVAALLFRIPALKYRLIPRAVKQQRAARLAREQFLLQNLHHTEGRTGVMLFVSLAEHYIEVIADKGINDAVPAGTWEWVVTDFVAKVKAGRIADGFVSAIAASGEHLIQHFPVAEGDQNELPNHLIEI